MTVDALRLSTDIEKGARGGPQFMTTVQALASGREQRNQEWVIARHRYDISYGIMSSQDADSSVREVRDFFYARRGKLRGFLFQDFADYKVTNPTSTSPAVGDGVETEFQLQRIYADTIFPYVRTITRPVSGTVKVFVNSVEQMSGWTVNTTTGIVTFSVAPTSGHTVTATFDFDVPVRFDIDALELEVALCDVESIPAISLVELIGE